MGYHLLIQANSRRIPLPDRSVHCVVTSPPYFGLRSYLDDGDPLKPLEIGNEPSPAEFVATMVEVFRDVRRVLRDDGTCWLNLGASYNSAASNQNGRGLDGQTRGGNVERGRNRQISRDFKPKDLIDIPFMVSEALREDGWYKRANIPWIKPSSMPESVTDRPSTAHEMVFLLTKRPTYFYDTEAVRIRAVCDGMNPMRVNAGRMEQEADPVQFRTRPMGRTCGYPSHRNRRTSDWFRESLDLQIEYHSERLAHLRRIKEKGGLLTNGDGDPMALLVASESFPGSHFATFPTKLVEPCIKAGTSEKGCCPSCGTPWVRVIEKGESDYKRLGGYLGCQFDRNDSVPNRAGQTLLANGTVPSLKAAPARHLGWRPSCPCPPADPIPCVVLDPFCGSGTTLLVARMLGRSAVGLDLSAEYLAMARGRIADGLKPVSKIDVPKPVVPLDGQLALF